MKRKAEKDGYAKIYFKAEKDGNSRINSNVIMQ